MQAASENISCSHVVCSGNFAFFHEARVDVSSVQISVSLYEQLGTATMASQQGKEDFTVLLCENSPNGCADREVNYAASH
eukprot:5026887-Amphidinium_carterae.2